MLLCGCEGISAATYVNLAALKSKSMFLL